MTGYKLPPRPATAWRDDALCQQFPTDMFFPNPAHASEAREAKNVCHACPVEKECLQFAVSQPDLVGIFGGTSYRERIVLRAKSAVA